MKLAICLIIKDENEYLEEWLNHHKQIGFEYFIIYDNQSELSVNRYLLQNNISEEGITIINWNDDKHGSQLRAYEHCCKNYKDFDYIAFIDTDEFICLNNHRTIQEYINNLPKFDALGIYWRMYGDILYPLARRKIENYTYYHENSHIKSIVNPEKVTNWNDPHFATLNGLYIDENKNIINSPIGKHTSKDIYIKHTWTRSLSEFEQKIKRGSGDKVIRQYTLENFYNYNKLCIKNN